MEFKFLKGLINLIVYKMDQNHWPETEEVGDFTITIHWKFLKVTSWSSTKKC